MNLKQTYDTLLFLAHRSWFLIIFCIGISLTNISAQTNYIPFRHLTIEDGLSDNWVHEAYMDNKGMMWFATHDGLSRYDGHHFKNFKSNYHLPGALQGDVLMSIKEGEPDIYWIACNGIGLIKLDATTEKFTSFSNDPENKNSISNDAATDIFVDKDGKIWIATFSGGLNSYDEIENSFQRFSMVENDREPESFMNNSVRHIIPDPLDNNMLWLATHTGIFHFDKKTGAKTHYPLSKGDAPAFAVSLAADDSGMVWIACENFGLIEFNRQTKQHSFLTDYLAVKSVVQKPPNELWIATLGKGIGVYNRNLKKWDFITTESSKWHSILSNDIYGLYLDKDNRIWVRDMTSGISVSKSSGSLFQQPVMPNEVSKALIQTKKFAFSSSTNQLFVASTSGDKVFVFDKTPTSYVFNNTITPIPNLDYKNKILDIITRSSDGNLLILVKTPKDVQLFQWEKSSSNFLPIALQGLENVKPEEAAFACMEEDKNGKIWIAFEYGKLLEWDGNSVNERKIGQFITKEKNPQIWKIIFDQDNNLWAASLTDGVCRLELETNKETHFSDNDGGFNGWRMPSIAALKNGKIWAGSSAAGIHEIDPKKPKGQDIKIYNQDNGMPDNKINGMVVAPTGEVWIATSRGLVKYNPTHDHFQQFGINDGLLNTFLDSGFEYLPNGQILIGQPNGFLSINPELTIDNSAPNIVHLSSFSVNGENFPLEKNLDRVEKIELQPTENYFTIQFSANYYDDQNKINYRYFLENYDRDWTTITSGIAQANFTNVPPGRYTFKVLVSNKEGNWAKTPTEVDIVIHPQWYWSTPMKFVYGFITLGILGLIFRFQRKRLMLQSQLQLEKTEAMRLKDLDGLKSRFFANVSHELRTPLTLILGPISTLLKEKELSNKQFALLKTAQNSGKDLLKLIGSILDLSKIESGKFEIKEEPELLFPFVRRIISSFESHAERSGIRFTFEYQIPKELRFEIDRDKMEIIFNNLLSNALKFTKDGGRVTFTASDLENVLQFSVKDTGRGIHRNDLPHVFDRFYQSQLPDAPTEGGTGIGLAVSQEYLKLMNGKIWVESEFGKGSQFYVEIPRKEVLGWTPPSDISYLEEEQGEVAPIFPIEQNSNYQHTSTILIVEDNYSLRNYLQTILASHFNIILAENGQIALDILSTLMAEKKPLPDLVLSDIMMPVMDGYQLLKALRAKDYFRSIPVVMLTARADIQDKLTALRIGVDDYLLKPFEEEELLARINNLLKNYSERKTFQTEVLNEENVEKEVQVEGDAVSDKKPISQEDQEWLAKLEKTILEHIADSRFNMDFLGEKMFSSRRQLQRKIKKIVGLTPKEYIKEIRLHEARQLLETQKTKSVKATAYEVGFSDPQYFSAQFKERFGKIPSAYLE